MSFLSVFCELGKWRVQYLTGVARLVSQELVSALRQVRGNVACSRLIHTHEEEAKPTP